MLKEKPLEEVFSTSMFLMEFGKFMCVLILVLIEFWSERCNGVSFSVQAALSDRTCTKVK